MEAVTVAAVDLGASSGRVMIGRVAPGRLEVTEASRFPNVPVEILGTLHWNVLALYRGVLDGLRVALREADHLGSLGIESWAVDYGILDRSGSLAGNPIHYRDARTNGVMEGVLRQVPASEIYEITGLQFLAFNTIYQLVAAQGTPQLEVGHRLLLIPDLLGYWLTGVEGAEVTNASTTQLLDVRARTWATGLMERVGINPALFPPLREPGDHIGYLRPETFSGVGDAEPVALTAVGSHDTASAVVSVPAENARFAYVSCGTWSLVGVELDSPVLTEESRRANFTNELGVDGTVRYLRNVMGLWLLQESLRMWGAAGPSADLEALLQEAAQVPAFTALVDPDAPAFLPPGDMPGRIAQACGDAGQSPPRNRAETVRCILDSLALAYRRTIRSAQHLAGSEVEVVHIVGGGARNALLCQLTADACALPVIAGPVEAAAHGNVLVQARALGAVSGDLHDLRALLRATQRLRRYEPTGSASVWDAAEARVYSSR